MTKYKNQSNKQKRHQSYVWFPGLINNSTTIHFICVKDSSGTYHFSIGHILSETMLYINVNMYI